MTTEHLRRHEGSEGTKTKLIDALPTNYLECRTLGHAWRIRWWGSVDELPEELVPPVARAFRWSRVRVSFCQRCHTIRDEFFPVADGRIIGTEDSHQAQYRRYRYATGYQLIGVGNSPARRLFTQEAYERWKLGDPDFGPT